MNFIDSPNWDFQRVGWRYAGNKLKEMFHTGFGLNFYEWADGRFRQGVPITSEWGGILHNVISYPKEYCDRDDIKILSLQELVHKDFFIESMHYCKVLFTLSQNTACFLRKNGYNAIAIKHPCRKFSEWKIFSGKIVTVGQWLRKIDSILKLETDFDKIVLKVPWESPYRNKTNINFVEYQSEREYDRLLSCSLVFLDLYDVAACNAILECIMNNIPILVNRLPGAEEYLGPDYPLFYESIEQASRLINERDIDNAHKYLANKDKGYLDISSFTSSFGDSINRVYKMTI